MNYEEKIEVLLYLVETQFEIKSFRMYAEERIMKVKEIQDQASALREKKDELVRKQAELVDGFMAKRYKSSTVSREIDLRASGNNYKKVSHHIEIIKKGIYMLESEYMARSPVLLAYNDDGDEVHFLGNQFLIYENKDKEG